MDDKHCIPCEDCGRVFNLFDENESQEYYYGHDCE